MYEFFSVKVNDRTHKNAPTIKADVNLLPLVIINKNLN
jgi:hypothetical protein